MQLPGEGGRARRLRAASRRRRLATQMRAVHKVVQVFGTIWAKLRCKDGDPALGRGHVPVSGASQDRQVLAGPGRPPRPRWRIWLPCAAAAALVHLASAQGGGIFAARSRLLSPAPGCRPA